LNESDKINTGLRACRAAPGLKCWQAIGRRLLNFPGGRWLLALLRLIKDVAQPAGHISVTQRQFSPAQQRCRGVVVLSANLWHDWPRHRRLLERMEVFARLVEAERAGIVLLQEVARIPGLRVDEWLAARLQMSHVYTRANGHERAIGFEEGLAIISRYPLSSPQLRQLNSRRNPFVRRLALSAVVDSPCGRLNVFSVHLGLGQRANRLQFTQLREWVQRVSGDTPALIGGDFNAQEKSSQVVAAQKTWLDTFRRRNPFGEAFTHELRFFLHSGDESWQVRIARHLDHARERFSDHQAVLVHVTPE